MAEDIHDAQHIPENGESKPMRKRYKTLIILLVIFAVGAVIGGAWWMYASQFQDTDDATITGHIHPVSARVSGNITGVFVEDNQEVKQGQLLVTLDPKDYQIAVSQAEHNLDVAKAQADAAKHNIPLAEQQAFSQITQARGEMGMSQAGISQAQKSVTEAQAGVSAASQAVQEQEANYQKAYADYQRYAGADPDAISAQQLDAAKASLKMAQANRDSAKAQLNQAHAKVAQAQSTVKSSVSKLAQSKGVLQGAQSQTLQVAVSKSQYANAIAAVETAEDAVEQAKLNLAYTQIRAAVSGRVGRRTAEIGQRIQAGEPLMSVVQPNIWVIANFKETQLKNMRLGQLVDIDVDAFPGKHFTGYVDSFSPASGAQFALLPPENATGNFTKIVQRIPVKIMFDAKSVRGYENLLTPGMSVIPRVHVTESPRRIQNAKHS